MIHRAQWPWLIGAFALCFLTAGAMWWTGSYQDFLNSGFRWGTLPLLSGVALVLTWVIGTGIVPSAIAVGCSFPAVIMTRIVLDCIGDPSNHNLWPFEVAMAFGMGMVMAFPPAGIGGLLRRVTHRRLDAP